MEQKVFVTHMMRNLKRIILEDRKYDYTKYNKFSSMTTLNVIKSRLKKSCPEFDSNLEFGMAFNIIRSGYKVTIMCGSPEQNKNAVIIENKKTGELIGKIIDGELDKETYNTTAVIADVLIRKETNIPTTLGYGKSAYELAVEDGFKGTKEEWWSQMMQSPRISPIAMDRIPLSYLDCDKFEELSGLDTDETSVNNTEKMVEVAINMYSNKNHDDYVEMFGFDTGNPIIDTYDMSESTIYILNALGECGILESITSTDELANITRSLYFEYTYNGKNLKHYDKDEPIADYISRLPMLRFAILMEDEIERIKSLNIKYNALSFMNLIIDKVTEMKELCGLGVSNTIIFTSYALEFGEIPKDSVAITAYFTKERTLQLFDETPGHEKLILFTANISDILEDSDSEILAYKTETMTSEELENSLATFTLILTQNQLFLSKLLELSLTTQPFFDMDNIFKNDDDNN